MFDLPLAHIGDHIDRAISMLPLYHRMPGKMALVRTIGEVFQTLEDRVFDQFITRTFPLARGHYLDEWGALFGVLRQGLDDTYYRRLILVSARAKRSRGTVDDTIRLWQIACDPCQVEFQRYVKHCISLTAYCQDSDWLPEGYARRAAEVVRRGCPVGSVVLLESRRPFIAYSDRSDWPDGGLVPAFGYLAKAH